MKRHLKFKSYFQVALSNRRAQVATMTLPPGGSEGGPTNRHRGSDQWLFVASGSGEAIVAGRKQKLRSGDVLLVARGMTHEIRNTGRRPLQTLNFYAPPAYQRNGEPLPRGRG